MVKNLSVFFPCVNEEGNIKTIVGKATKVLEDLKIDYEIIIVDDGSTDSTAGAADKLAKKNPKVRVIHHEKNLGYGEALKSGFYNAKYDVIVYTDGDGQFDFAEVKKFLEKIEDHDLLIGYRIKRQDPFFRILFKKGWALSLFTMFGLTLKDVDCGFKMIRRKVLEKIPHLESQRGAMINAELAIKSRKAGFKIGQVGVNHYPRLTGTPTGANLKVILSSYFDLLKLWWKLKDSKILFLALIGVILLASYLRFYKLSEYMLFLGDEGRDVIIVKKMLTEFDFPFIGPPSSVGNIYLGPLYYYMMAVPMAFSWLNPVAASAMVAIIGVLTVILIYYLAKIWFGRIPALISSFLYAISPVNINYSKFSWNPNPAPFFALFGIWGAYKAYQSKNFNWYILVGFTLAAALQMHYLALILVPVFFILWLYQLKKKKNKNVWQGTIGGIVTFLVMMSPLALFDLKHNFLNSRAISEILFNGQSIGFNILSNLLKIAGLYFYNLIGRYMSGEILILSVVVGILILLPVVIIIGQSLRKKNIEWSIFSLSVWLILGLLGLSFYKSNIYDHYFGFLNPASYLLFAASIALILNSAKTKMTKVLARGSILIILIFLTIANFQKSPLLYPGNNQLKRTQDIAKEIISASQNRPYNFALLAENNYDSAYQYYLDLYCNKPKQLPFEKTDQLFVVCEDPICQPINHPKQEISHFGWAKIEWEKEIFGVKLFKLVPNPSGKP